WTGWAPPYLDTIIGTCPDFLTEKLGEDPRFEFAEYRVVKLQTLNNLLNNQSRNTRKRDPAIAHERIMAGSISVLERYSVLIHLAFYFFHLLCNFPLY